MEGTRELKEKTSKRFRMETGELVKLDVKAAKVALFSTSIKACGLRRGLDLDPQQHIRRRQPC